MRTFHIRTLLCLAGLSLAGGCAINLTGLVDITPVGVYSLRSVNGDSLPAKGTKTSQGDSLALTYVAPSSMIINADMTLVLKETVTVSGGGRTDTVSVVRVGHYTVAGKVVTFNMSDGRQLTGDWDGLYKRVIVSSGPDRLDFRK